MMLPTDYAERVYAGVLGKIIGVYLGRPFEGWSHKDILAQLGEINYYVHEQRGVPLIVSDDDITGTFTFVRALEDYGFSPHLTAEQIGQTWLNYIIENKTILWWGGMGMSTEHTAYLRLKNGIAAPRSGSMELNGKVVAEQIGSQIFIEGWAMVCPGNPKLAVDLAGKAASVSHDGEAIYGAQIIAAMASLAFVETDLNQLLERALSLVPRSCAIAAVIHDLRECRARHEDWHEGLGLVHRKYSYEKFGGNCHIIPNHAVVMLGLLWGNDDFQRSLMITNTAGYDTDCNSANVGCLLGIKNGLTGIDAGPDWRGPVADRLLLPTADGGRCISDAVSETYALVNMGRALAGEGAIAPKNGARFHFDLPGSVQGFVAEETPQARDVLRIENAGGKLALRFDHLAPGRFGRAMTQTFMSIEQSKMAGYAVLASPTLYAGQRVTAGMIADEGNNRAIQCRLYLRHFNGKDELTRIYAPLQPLLPGSRAALEWVIPPADGQPIAEIGVELSSEHFARGVVYLDFLTWEGAPDVVLKRPEDGGTMWMKAFVDGMQQRVPWAAEVWSQNHGTGLLIQGTRQWKDYSVSCAITPHMVKSAGLAARVQGMQRYYALLLCDDQHVRLVKMLDGRRVLGEKAFAWEFGQTYELRLEVKGAHIAAWVDSISVFEVTDSERPLDGGAIAIVCEEGRGKNGPITIHPV